MLLLLKDLELLLQQEASQQLEHKKHFFWYLLLLWHSLLYLLYDLEKHNSLPRESLEKIPSCKRGFFFQK